MSDEQRSQIMRKLSEITNKSQRSFASFRINGSKIHVINPSPSPAQRHTTNTNDDDDDNDENNERPDNNQTNTTTTAQSRRRADVKYKNPQYLDQWDIKQRAIQIFHTEDAGRHTTLTPPRKSSVLDPLIIHPNGRFRSSFDALTVAWVLFLMFMIPFEISFAWYKVGTVQKSFLVLLDVWFAIDIVLNFFTGYIHHGTLVMSPEKIMSNYLRKWFVVDFVGTFPFELIIRSDPSSRKSIKLIKYFKIPKMLRVSRLMKYMKFHRHVYDIFQVFMLVFTTLHLGSCGWAHVVDPCNELNADPTTAFGKYAGEDVCALDNIFNLYAEAVHTSSVMILGISDYNIVGGVESLGVVLERHTSQFTKCNILSTAYNVFGLFLIALLFSEMNCFVMGKKQGSAAFQRLNDRVKHEMEYYGVPEDLQVQVRAFYDYVWIHQKQYDDKIALLSDQQMSTDLQRKLALHLFKDVVSHISFFSEVDDFLLGEICLSLRTRIFLPMDMIIFKGDVGKELFIISKGAVEVLRDDLPARKRQSAPPILLRNGSFFGEIALVMECRRTCSVRARTICEVNVLQQKEFDAILRENPDFARRMNELVVARQLDTRLARSTERRVDFRVSRKDLDDAVTAVETNMKMGLERRMIQGGTYRYNDNNGKLNRLDKFCESDSVSESGPDRGPPVGGGSSAATGDCSSSEVQDAGTLDEGGSCGGAGAQGKPDDNTTTNTTTPSLNNRTKVPPPPEIRRASIGPPTDVSNMLDDIARRSTIFMGENTQGQLFNAPVVSSAASKMDVTSDSTNSSSHERDDGNDDDTPACLQNFVVAGTQTETRPPRHHTAQQQHHQRRHLHRNNHHQQYHRQYHSQRKLSHRLRPARRTWGSENELTAGYDLAGEDGIEQTVMDSAAGHFSPGRSVVDIHKVRASILRPAQEDEDRRLSGRGRQRQDDCSAAAATDEMKRLGDKMVVQERMMDRLLSKLEDYDRQNTSTGSLISDAPGSGGAAEKG